MTDDTPAVSATDTSQADRIAAAPRPVPAELRRRQNVLFQAGRFLLINLKMIRVIGAKHS